MVGGFQLPQGSKPAVASGVGYGGWHGSEYSGDCWGFWEECLGFKDFIEV